MSEHCYRLHDLTVRIRCERGFPPWVFQKLDYFAVSPAGAGQDLGGTTSGGPASGGPASGGPASGGPTSGGGPSIDITVGPFACDTGLMRNVDHRYFARAGELYFVGRWNGVRYRTRWSGLHGDHIKVALDVPMSGLGRFPWLQQADWIAHLFVIKPLSEWLWARRGRFVMHAAAAERDGQAAVFCGFGSSLKTSFVMQLVRDGWALIGDDQVLLTEQGLLPLPIGLRTFDFRVNRLPDEYLTRWRTLRLGWHLWREVDPGVRVSDGPASIAAMNLLTRSDRPAAFTASLDADEAAARVIAQCRAEAVQSVRGSPPLGEPMMAWAMMDDAADIDAPWHAMRALLAKQLRRTTVRRVELTRRWDKRLMDAVAVG